MARIRFFTDEQVSKAVVMGIRVVYATQERPVVEIIRGLMLIHEVLEAEELAGRVEFL